MEDKINNFCDIGIIKSNYILEIIFNLLFGNKKLKLIAYNKYIKENLEKNKGNYKSVCQRQIIFEANGKGKEYLKNTNIIII